MPSDIAVDSLNDYQIAKLNRLKDWLYQRQTRVRLDTKRVEQQRQEEKVRKEAEQPALFEF